MKNIFKELAGGRLFGHPVHPMLVHFPTALFTTTLLFDVAGLYSGDRSFAYAAFYCLCVGEGTGLLAALFGVVDYLKLTGNDRLFAKASRHAVIQLLVMVLFGILTVLRWQAYPRLFPVSGAEILTGAAGVFLMVTGNYIGGDMVFSDRVGIGKADGED